MMKTDLQVQRDVEEELRYDPRIDAGQIKVTARQGVIELEGTVDTYASKGAVEEATKRVEGVRAVTHRLTVKLPVHHRRSDAALAAAVEAALAWDVYVPRSVTGTVASGAVTLQGTVNWHFQREAASSAVRRLAGVVAVHDELSLVSQAPEAPVTRVREQVLAALQRQARRDGRSIEIAASAGTVTLMGHATCRQAVDEATSAAWAVPGVTEVIDEVELRAEPPLGDGAGARTATMGARWNRRANAK